MTALARRITHSAAKRPPPPAGPLPRQRTHPPSGADLTDALAPHGLYKNPSARSVCWFSSNASHARATFARIARTARGSGGQPCRTTHIETHGTLPTAFRPSRTSSWTSSSPRRPGARGTSACATRSSRSAPSGWTPVATRLTRSAGASSPHTPRTSPPGSSI